MCSQHARSMASSSMYARSGIASPPLVAERSRRYTQVQPETPRRTVRLSPVTVIAAVLFAGLVAGAIVQRASATPTDLAARTEVWLERTLGVELPSRPIVESELDACVERGISCSAIASADRIELHPTLYADLVRADERRRDGYGTGATLIHEMLHSDRDLERTDLAEGIVEAVAKDLYLPWARAMGLERWHWFPAESPYFDELVAVRKASARATGKPWTSRAARLWRRDLWRADAATRVAVYEAAWR
jgi:hypothetical protein